MKQAASLLDEEIALGVIAARKVQARFAKDRSIDPADFHDALQRFQGDAHELVSMLEGQLGGSGNGANTELTRKLVGNVHDLLDLFVGFVNIGSDLASQLAQTHLPKNDER